ncbi:MAG: hypothetical protein AABX17_01280 [Nanoarchaeota archaeon]
MNESLHIKIEREDAVAIKKNILISESDLLETIRYTRNYNLLRKQELVLKEKMQKELAALHLIVQAIEANLPKEGLHYQDEQEKTEKSVITQEVTKSKKKQNKVIEKHKNELEQEIDNIRERLAQLG